MWWSMNTIFQEVQTINVEPMTNITGPASLTKKYRVKRHSNLIPPVASQRKVHWGSSHMLPLMRYSWFTTVSFNLFSTQWCYVVCDICMYSENLDEFYSNGCSRFPYSSAYINSGWMAQSSGIFGIGFFPVNNPTMTVPKSFHRMWTIHEPKHSIGGILNLFSRHISHPRHLAFDNIDIVLFQ